jgi:GT2 family glycosyltransferase
VLLDPGLLPLTSLIVCSRNRPRMLLETIESVLQGTDLPAELIVIDQSAERHPVLSGLVADARCRLRYIWSDSVGLSRARNLGLAAASHPIVAFIDDDMRVAQEWYAALIRALVQAGPSTVVTGRVLAGPPEVAHSFASSLHESEQPVVHEGRVDKDVLAGGHCAMYRAVFDAIGTFDERLGAGAEFPAAEDNDFGFRLLEAGYRTAYAPEAIVYHRSWRGRDGYVPVYWNYGRGQGAYYAKHLTMRDRRMLRRFQQDVWLYLRFLPRRVLGRRLLEIQGSTAFVVGLFVGAVQWRWTQPA